ncbi:MAG: hypothetical protein U9N57_01375 [Pseudomonadota bacterium]|nr:hypothetical protein [Pseudomonadota bacterium]
MKDKVVKLHPENSKDSHSTIEDEMRLIAFELKNILDSAEAMTRYSVEGQQYELRSIHERCNNILIRTQRSVQISNGKKVPKS